MPTRAHRPTIALLSAPDTLEGIEGPLARSGVRVLRLSMLTIRPIPPGRWPARSVKARAIDTVLATSRAGVEAGVAVWLRGPFEPRPRAEFWGIGPGTAAALRRVGARPVHRPTAAGTPSLVVALRRRPARRILYFRSDRAGPELARRLRRAGHRVTEIIAYRVTPSVTLDAPARRRLEASSLWVGTSPSALGAVRQALGRRRFDQLRGTVCLVVLGEGSRRAAADLGFRQIRIVRPGTTQRFTRDLLRVLDDVGA